MKKKLEFKTIPTVTCHNSSKISGQIHFYGCFIRQKRMERNKDDNPALTSSAYTEV